MPGRVFYFHGEELRAPDFSTVEEKLAFALRRVCHLLVDRIDSKGLQEVCQSLAEFYEYYRPTEASTYLLPESRTLSATVGSRSSNPTFVIGEE